MSGTPLSRRAPLAVAILCLVASFVPSLAAQEEEQELTPEQLEAMRTAFFAQWNWHEGPLVQKVGEMASVRVPEGLVSLDAADAQSFIRALGNIPGSLLAVVAPPDHGWFTDFEFEDIGYVKDDEKDELDADAMLTAMKEAQEHANERRRSAGMEALHIIGFEEQPYYDDDLNSLAWALRLRDDSGQESINYKVRLLGRKGVMHANYVVDPEGFRAALPAAKQIFKNLSFDSGERYADFREGDKTAAYGLTALVTGGALAIAAKSGLLQKFWKVLVLGFLAVVGFAKKLFGGGKKRVRRTSAGDES